MPPVNIESNDLYERLGVSPDATADQIRKAFQRLSRIHHPDKNPNDAQSATRRFQKIQEAYYVLSDTVRKRDYDQRRCGFSNRGHSASASGCNEERTFYFEGGSFTYSGPGSFTFSGPGSWSFTNGGNAFNFNCFDNDDGDWDSSDSDDYYDDYYDEDYDEGPDQGYDRVITNGVHNDNIHCSGNISVKKGVVNGNLKTPKSVIITGGVINGNVIADKVIMRGGVVNGNLRGKTVDRKGGILNGSVKRG